MLGSLVNLKLNSSANFSTNESTSYLALMLTKAKNLKLVDISYQRGDRKIEVKCIDEVDERIDKETKEKILIFERDTGR